jgi:hypothetical protein
VEEDAMPPSEYEIRARQQIWQWKNPRKSWFDKVSDLVSWPLDRAGEVLMDNRFGEAVSKSMIGAISVLNDISQRSIDAEPILNRYRRLTDLNRPGFPGGRFT